MTFIELVESVAQKTGLTKSDVKNVLKNTAETVSNTALTGEQVMIPKFGRFMKKVIKPRTMPGGFKAPERTTIKFRPFV